FRQALARDPADAVTRYSHALTLLELCAGKSGSEMEQLRREAEEEFNAALDLSRDQPGRLPMAWVHLARIYEQRNDKTAAIAALEQYLRLVPAAPNATAVREMLATLLK
ncbi:MAG: tetratricopeptide repeat protein, partial [Blastocatellia bacterium]